LRIKNFSRDADSRGWTRINDFSQDADFRGYTRIDNFLRDADFADRTRINNFRRINTRLARNYRQPAQPGRSTVPVFHVVGSIDAWTTLEAITPHARVQLSCMGVQPALLAIVERGGVTLDRD